MGYVYLTWNTEGRYSVSLTAGNTGFRDPVGTPNNNNKLAPTPNRLFRRRIRRLYGMFCARYGSGRLAKATADNSKKKVYVSAVSLVIGGVRAPRRRRSA